MNTFDLLTVASGILALGTILCYLTVVIQMFMHGESGVAVASLVLLCCGVGGLIAFGYGWWKVNEWENILLMSAWTCCFVLSFALRIFMVVSQHPM
ncbi:MAG TPA: hypothetical protein VGN42_12940 [Pirellulales bacterium]|jgi:hypothetical protein|nr:hypothetical protein [Pirellulales bacterium]